MASSCAPRSARVRASCAPRSARDRAGSSRRGAQLRRRRFGERAWCVGMLARGGAGQRLDAAHARGDGAFRTILNRPISPVRRTCVPPHSSTEKPSALLAASRAPSSPIVTTRTSSPYFSPNSARAPASHGDVGRHQARRDLGVLRQRALARPRSRAGPPASAAWLAKSKRRRSGATSEPFCVTCAPSSGAAPGAADASPNGWRAARCARRRRLRARRRRRPSACRAHRAEMHEQIAGVLLRVGDGERAAFAGHRAGVADLAAGLARRTASG